MIFSNIGSVYSDNLNFGKCFFTHSRGYDLIDDGSLGLRYERVPSRDEISISNNNWKLNLIKNSIALVIKAPLLYDFFVREAAQAFAYFIKCQGFSSLNDIAHIISLSDDYKIMNDREFSYSEESFVQEYNRIISTVLLLG